MVDADTQMTVGFRTPDEIARDALVGEVRRLLNVCTEPQQVSFHRIFPEGIDAMYDNQLRAAIGLCQRTIAGNSNVVSYLDITRKIVEGCADERGDHS